LNGDAPVGVILAAGEGTRLRPLTTFLPKALCPIDNRAMLDIAADRMQLVTSEIAVNVAHMPESMLVHVADRFHVSLESQRLGTAGALGALREWIAGRAVLVHNVDAWHDSDLSEFVAGWDGERIRMLTIDTGEPSDFGTLRFCGVSLMPWTIVEGLKAEPGGLWRQVWSRLHQDGMLEFYLHEGRFIDCGTHNDYLQANLTANGGRSVIGDGAVVEGKLTRSVVWPGGHVGRDEHLVDAIRVGRDVTVQVAGK
jgi:N-acetyl-alpha-D-muramate 1-phosphate uridylyltransferase